MPKVKSKQDVLQLVSTSDVLATWVESIERKEPTSSKNAKESAFVKALRDFIREQRDVILIAVKIR